MSNRPLARVLVAVLLLALRVVAHGADPGVAISAVAALTDPARIATLTGPRAAKDRLHKTLAWLEEARRGGMHPSKTLDEAQKLTGDTRLHASAVKETLLRNFELCQRGAMRRTLRRKYECVQLYKSYLEDFRINTQDALNG